MKENQLQLNFHTCIFDSFEIPKDDQWVYDMKRERDEKFKKDIQRLSALINKYSKI